MQRPIRNQCDSEQTQGTVWKETLQRYNKGDYPTQEGSGWNWIGEVVSSRIRFGKGFWSWEYPLNTWERNKEVIIVYVQGSIGYVITYGQMKDEWVERGDI